MVAAVVGLGLAASLLLGVSVNVAGAQSMTLAQLVNLFITMGIIPADKAQAALAAVGNSSTAAAASSYTYSTDLTVGSTGADVTALQNQLGVSPATGYFGAITKAAVVKYQTANGISPTGYVGPLTRESLSGSSMTTTTTTTTTSSTASTGVTSSTVTNTGVEGILTVNLNSLPSSGQDVYAGDSKDALLGIKLQAQLSPISIQRVQVDLGNSSTIYNKFFSNLYLVSDTGQVLAQSALNPNTVTKQTSGANNEYYITFSGFNYTVPGDNSVHVLTVEGDTYSSIDTTLDGKAVAFGIDQNGIRGVDGAGVDQYGPTTNSATPTAYNWGSQTVGIYNSVSIQDSLSDSAQLQLSTDSATPLSTNAVASQGSGDNELDGQTMLVFDLYAQKDWIQLDNLTANVSTSATGGGTASATTLYLFSGSTQISSAAVASNGTATFQNINYKIAQNTTQPFTIKADIKNASTGSNTISVAVAASGVLAENSQGNTINATLGSLTGSAQGNGLLVSKAGPVFTLSGVPTLTKVNTAGGGSTQSQFTYTATFNIQAAAVGESVDFALPVGNVGSFGTSTTGTNIAQVYQDGVGISTTTVAAYRTPSTGVTTDVGTGGSFTLAQNQTMTIPVTYSFTVSNPGSHVYAVQLNGIMWNTSFGYGTTTSNFMAGQTAWETSAQ